MSPASLKHRLAGDTPVSSHHGWRHSVKADDIRDVKQGLMDDELQSGALRRALVIEPGIDPW